MAGFKRSQSMKLYRSTKRFKPSLSRKVAVLQKKVALSRNLGFNDTFTTVNASSTGSVTLLNGIAEGVADDERLGNKINMVGLQYIIGFRPDVSQTVSLTADVVVVYDKQTNAAQPAVADVFTESNLGFIQWSDRDRFRILRRFSMQVGNDACYGDNKSGYVKLDLPVNYSGTDNTISSITTGGLYCYVVGNGTAGTNITPEVVLSFRLTYDQ